MSEQGYLRQTGCKYFQGPRQEYTNGSSHTLIYKYLKVIN